MSNTKLSQANKTIRKFLASRQFFYLIILLGLVQALWYAFSYKMAFFDEPQHFGFIYQYAHHLNPFISHQPDSWDFLGGAQRDPNYLFYYLMSFPLRLVGLVFHSMMAQLICLRLIMIAFFLGGVIMFRKIFYLLKVPPTIINFMALFIVLTPNLIALAATVNYDNAIFLLFPILIYLSLRTLDSKKVDLVNLSLIIALGLLASLVKFSFLTLFLPVAAFLTYDLWTKHKTKVFNKLADSYRRLGVPTRLFLIALLLLSAGLFIERPVENLARYRNVVPACQTIISEKRCMKNLVSSRNIELAKEKPPGFKPYNPYNYATIFWLPSMTTTLTRVLGATNPLPVMEIAYYTGAFAGLALILMYLRRFVQQKAYAFLLFVALFYVLALFMEGYQSYTSYALPLGMNGRYLLPILPIFLLFAGLAFKELVNKRLAPYSGAFAIIILLLFTQGGGITSTILTLDQPYYYWSNEMVLRANDKARTLLHPVVYEHSPYLRF